MAHHADDQAETVLMRLASGQRRHGLQGMKAFTNIPECWGIHGIDNSGQFEATAARMKRRSKSGLVPEFDPREQQTRQILASSPLLESGGVTIMRPLLKFRKQDLIDTCVAQNVAWVEDETNKDVWRTPRNAVRSQLSTNQLPRALRSESLVKLASYMESKNISLSKLADHLLKQCQISLFDLRSGTIVVRLPKHLDMDAISSVHFRDHDKWRTFVESLVIRKLALAVTPNEDISLNSLQSVTRAMFPNCAPPSKPNLNHLLKLTAADVQFRHVYSPQGGPSDAAKGNQHQPSSGLDPDFVWNLSRQPHRRSSEECQPSVTVITFPPSSPWSPWSLWDGRYWIRVLNSTDHALQVRPFRSEDLSAVRKSILSPRQKSSPRAKAKALDRVLTIAAPDKTRWTLPGIFKSSKDGIFLGKLFALPTLGKSGIFDLKDEDGVQKVSWQVRYKRVDSLITGYSGGKIDRSIVTSWEDP